MQNIMYGEILRETPLIRAASWGFSEIVKELLAHGADCNTSNYNGLTALMIAAKSDFGIGRKLLIQTLPLKDQEAARIKIQQEFFNTVKTLIAHSALINTQDNYGRIALDYAIRRHTWEHEYSNITEIVTFLITHGANCNTQDNDGDTPLIWASARGLIDVVEILLNHGALINVKDVNGNTALSDALKYRHTEIAELLKAHGALE